MTQSHPGDPTPTGAPPISTLLIFTQGINLKKINKVNDSLVWPPVGIVHIKASTPIIIYEYFYTAGKHFCICFDGENFFAIYTDFLVFQLANQDPILKLL